MMIALIILAVINLLLIFIFFFYGKGLNGESRKLRDIKSFMIKAEQEVPERFTIPDRETVKLRAELILEELQEYLQEVGLEIKKKRGVNHYYIKDPIAKDSTLPDYDLTRLVDAIVDLDYVVTGTYVAFGLKDLPLFSEVHRANMDKFGPGSYKREDGKWVKPPNHKSPDLEPLILKQMIK